MFLLFILFKDKFDIILLSKYVKNINDDISYQ
jgi:hypothetical protein